MAITVRLTIDVEVPILEDSDESAKLVGRACIQAIYEAPYAPPLQGVTMGFNLVGVSRQAEGPMRGSVSIEPVVGQIWERVEQEAL